jgi:hypothetical protein
MTWLKYKTWLEENILEKTENEEEIPSYSLRPEAKSHYSLANEKSFTIALTNLIQSINNSYSEEENEYHSLPDLPDLITKNNQPLTWQQLFPDHTKTLFGSQTNTTPPDPSTFQTLAKIFNHWVQDTTRLTRLQSALNQDELLGQFFLEAAINLNYDLIKRKGYDQQLKIWQQEYNKLESCEKEQLKTQKEMVDKFLTTWEEEKASRLNQATENNQSWYSNWNWSEIGKWGLIATVFLTSLLLVKKLWKD